MNHLLEILKIIEGGLNADSQKVGAYSNLLAERLISEGEKSPADRILKLLRNAENSVFKTTNMNLTPLPVDAESRLNLADEELLDSDSVEIFLSHDAEELIRDFIAYVNAADTLIAQGIGISPSLLLYGPPGCGKTETARYIASRLKLPLITARSDTLISSYLGNTAKNIRYLFEHANKRPCVLFLDELDALAKVRDDQNELGELKRVVVSLLQNLDSLDSHTIVIAATNHDHLLDPAVWRRFAYKLKMDKPDMTARRALLKTHLGNYANKALLDEFCELTHEMSGSDIKQVSLDIVRHAVVRNNGQIDEKYAIKKIFTSRFGRSIFAMEPSVAMQDLRRINKKIFTYERLASIFDISVGKISNLLRDKVD